ncbi:hypothetical protein N7532_001910 [Penicillium argentinense]|uniref:Beta-glucuronidase C-terminal domain-containing protein n=1 Tax=Penicillium argentinense TaxID=1131581 RepID=A0A9W9KM86_9EURO|nr:uncharacterized protein N7532_001910 [Penicillium argentinense]KAJ5111375.1 hypothetical protein N7532_001910 [Penicillium argentinense]
MFIHLLAGAAAAAAVPTAGRDSSPVVDVGKDVPGSAGAAVLHPFVSFSIEFSSFPDFAGNLSHPNKFSDQLLDNLRDLQGVKPHIRVGGNTQDLALYDPDLKISINGTFVPSVSTDYPSIIYIGDSYFESYATWPGTKFSHGFNLGKNGTTGMKTLVGTVPLACKALQDGNLAYWELGNEPDLFPMYPVRPAGWDEQAYVDEWLAKTKVIERQLKKSCPELVTKGKYKYIAPSFAGLTNSLDPVKAWQAGLDDDHDIGMNSMHNYIGGADEPGVTLARTLMNHTSTVHSVNQHVYLSGVLNEQGLTKDIPYILGETNSLYHQGKPGLSNSFGAALWGVDFNLYCASQSIRRTHMHQGTDYRYDSWQPVQTTKTTIGTKAPYYGNIMVAAMLRGATGGDSQSDVQVTHLSMPHETESAYAAYVNGNLARIAVINMQEFNYTTDASRPAAKYTFRLPDILAKSLSVQRLLANGSDAITGISWDGWSYNYELEMGKPVRLSNVTVGEMVAVSEGQVELSIPYSSAAILNVDA